MYPPPHAQTRPPHSNAPSTALSAGSVRATVTSPASVYDPSVPTVNVLS